MVTTVTASARFLRIGRLLLALFVFSGLALADGIDTLTVTGIDGSQGGYYLWMNERGVNVNQYFVGVIDISLTQNGVTYNRETMCADLFTDITFQSYSNIVQLPINIIAVPPGTPGELPSGNDLQSVSWLIDNVMLPYLYPGQFTSALPPAYWLSPAGSSLASGTQLGEALQLVIWDMTVDNADGFSSGLVQASTAPGELTDPVVLDIAQFYEAAALGHFSDDAYVYVNWLGSTPAQMLEGPMFFDNGPKPVAPEPATFVLVGGALIGLGWSWRRRMRKPGSRRA